MPGATKSSVRVSAPVHCLGIDLSLNHAGFVELRDGILHRTVVVTSTKSVASLSPNNNAILIEYPAGLDPDTKSLYRLSWWRAHLPDILSKFTADYVAIEDYAYSAKQGAHQIGELGGVIRTILWEGKYRWRKYTPQQIKLFATGKGNAQKEDMISSVAASWKEDWLRLRPPGTKILDSAEDMADAHAAARLLWTEVQLRRGTTALQDLPESTIQVFNSVSKASKTNLLGSSWICKP